MPTSDAIRLIPFAEPVPRRQIAMVWRTTTVRRNFLPELATLFRDPPHGAIPRR